METPYKPQIVESKRTETQQKLVDTLVRLTTRPGQSFDVHGPEIARWFGNGRTYITASALRSKGVVELEAIPSQQSPTGQPYWAVSLVVPPKKETETMAKKKTTKKAAQGSSTTTKKKVVKKKKTDVVKEAGTRKAKSDQMKKEILSKMTKGKEYTSRDIVLAMGKTPGAKEGGPIVRALTAMAESGEVSKLDVEGSRGHSWKKN